MTDPESGPRALPGRAALGLRRAAAVAATASLALPSLAAAHGVTTRDADAPAGAPSATTTLAVVPGATAAVRADGTAAVPRAAPAQVRHLIAAANEIIGRPYRWGGGHASLQDTGYDCSGAVSYALIRAGLLDGVQTSAGFAGVLRPGVGAWITVYGAGDHAYLEVAGLRLDTSSYGDPSGREGVWWRPAIGARDGFVASHPAGL